MTTIDDIKFLIHKFCDARHIIYLYTGEYLQNNCSHILQFKLKGHITQDDVYSILMALKNINQVNVLDSMDFDYTYLQIMFTY